MAGGVAVRNRQNPAAVRMFHFRAQCTNSCECVCGRGRNVVCSVRCDRRMEVYTKRKSCGFLGITLAECENEVVFSFEEPGLKAGVGISILGFAFLLILFFARRKAEAGWKIAAEQKGKAEKCFGMLYRLLLAVFFAGIYVVPTIGMVVSLTGKIMMKFFG